MVNDFLSALFELPTKVKYCFTSRNLQRLTDCINANVKIPVTAQDKDLKRYVKHRLEKASVLKQRIDEKTKEQQGYYDLFCETIVERAQKT